MWRVFSCACWLSVCLLRRNVYLGLLPAFGLGCFFYVKLYEPFMYFGLLVSFAQSVVSDSLPPLEQPHTRPQASLSFTVSWSVLTLMSIESVMPSNHLILCCPLLLPPSIFPSIRVFPSESAVHIRGPKCWSFTFSISLSNFGC